VRRKDIDAGALPNWAEKTWNTDRRLDESVMPLTRFAAFPAPVSPRKTG
jgi:hypothetical protein